MSITHSLMRNTWGAWLSLLRAISRFGVKMCIVEPTQAPRKSPTQRSIAQILARVRCSCLLIARERMFDAASFSAISSLLLLKVERKVFDTSVHTRLHRKLER